MKRKIRFGMVGGGRGAFVGPLRPDQIGVCSSTAYGSLDSITELNLVAELEDPRYINPARFPNTVINAAAGYVILDYAPRRELERELDPPADLLIRQPLENEPQHFLIAFRQARPGRLLGPIHRSKQSR